jgi:PPP family 3-phenylpropionic acid transporter
MPVYLALGSGLPALLGNMTGGVIVQTIGFRPLFAIYAGTAVVALMIFFVMGAKNRSYVSTNGDNNNNISAVSR